MSAIIFEMGICICQRPPNMFLVFSYDIDEKATVVLGEMSETYFTIFLTLLNRFTPLVMSFVPTCITISSGLFFNRLSKFCVIFSLVPPEKLVTETLCF